MSNRWMKVGLGISIFLYMLLVCINNITDYWANFQFVHKVLAMEDIFSREKNGWRSVNSRVFQHIFYVSIIAWEIVITILVTAGVFGMINKIRAPASEFTSSGKWLKTGIFLGIILWFTIFVSLGGEWFLMWQSKIWNGQQTAFMLTICFLLILLFQTQRDE